MYLGLSDRADEVYIGLSDGSVARARTPKRREATARHDFPFLQRLTARLWDPRGLEARAMENWGRDPWWLPHPWRQGHRLANSPGTGECTSLERTWTAMGTRRTAQGARQLNPTSGPGRTRRGAGCGWRRP